MGATAEAATKPIRGMVVVRRTFASAFTVAASSFDRLDRPIQRLDQLGRRRQSHANAFEDQGLFCGATSTGGGATGWLNTTAPVAPGEVITLQFIIWDTGDVNWDSSVLLDHFTWQPGPTTTGTTRPSQ